MRLRIETVLIGTGASIGGAVNSTSNFPENSENKDESDQSLDAVESEDGGESSSDEPVVIEGEVIETEESAQDLQSSEADAENFPPDDEPDTENFGDEIEDVDEAAPVAPAAEPQKSSPMPLVFGGLLAGAIGFCAAYFLPTLSGEPDQMSDLSASVETNSSGLAELTARIDEIGASIPPATDTSGLESAISAVETSVGTLSSDVQALKNVPPVDLSELSASIATLSERVTALEIEDGNASSAQAEAAKAELQSFQVELQSMIAEAQSQIETAEDKAAAVEAAAAEAAALAQKKAELAELRSAVDSGGEFSDLVAAMSDVPAEIADHAKDGIPTLDVLQRQFPDAARAALGAVQTIPEDATTGSRLVAFLKRQTNARSISPREGDDPDAVLSRAQALLGTGNLSDALAEVDALPSEAQEAMAGWLADAHIRQSALDAVDALSQKVN